MTSPPPAPLVRRLTAWLIDLLITPVLPITVYLAIGTAFSDDIPPAVAYTVAPAFLAFHFLYAPLLLALRRDHFGQTLGKQAVGIRVIRAADGAGVRVGRTLVREILARSLLGFVPFYLVADLVTALARSDRRAVHDLAAGTTVVAAAR